MRVISRSPPATVAARPVAVTRIAVAVACVIDGLEKLHLALAIDDVQVVAVPYGFPGASALRPLAPGASLLWIAGAALLSVGLFARAAAAATSVGIGLFLALDQQLFANHTYLLCILTGSLAFVGSGSAYGLDASLRGRGHEAVTAWPVQVIKLQISIVYLFALLSKLQPDFLAGTLLEPKLAGELYLRVLRDVPGAARVLALSAVAFEAVAFWELWVPRFRRVVMVLGVVFHVGILAIVGFSPGLVAFSVATVGCYPLFRAAAIAIPASEPHEA